MEGIVSKYDVTFNKKYTGLVYRFNRSNQVERDESTQKKRGMIGEEGNKGGRGKGLV